MQDDFLDPAGDPLDEELSKLTREQRVARFLASGSPRAEEYKRILIEQGDAAKAKAAADEQAEAALYIERSRIPRGI